MDTQMDARIAIGVAVLELILKYGLPAALKLIDQLQKNNPTADDIRALQFMVPHPDTYEVK